MGKFLPTKKLPKMTQDEIENCNRLIQVKRLTQSKNLPERKNPGPDSFTGELYQRKT